MELGLEAVQPDHATDVAGVKVERLELVLVERLAGNRATADTVQPQEISS